MSRKPQSLDYEVVHSKDGFSIWTPDDTGAIIGSGDTQPDAIRHAIGCLSETIAELKLDLVSPKTIRHDSL